MEKEKAYLPVFNFSLRNLPGECWRGIPGLEEHVLISQFGRVKRKPRRLVTINGAHRRYGTRILKPNVTQHTNFTQRKYRFDIKCMVQIEHRHYTFSPIRMVYHLFKEQFPYEDPHYRVIPINGNDLDIRPENLMLSYVEIITDTPYTKLNVEGKIKLYKKLKVPNAFIRRRQYVSCYNEKGGRIQTFNNLKEASTDMNLPVNSLQKAIKMPFLKLQEAYWRVGRKEHIDVFLIYEDQKQQKKEREGPRITQFDLNGSPINFYSCPQDAAKENGISRTKIEKALKKGNSNLAGFYLWRKGWIDRPIPGL